MVLKVMGASGSLLSGFGQQMVRMWRCSASRGMRRFWKLAGFEIGDMATFNYVAYTKWADMIET